MSTRDGRRGEKWELPGWRIEQKYCQGVLIGNWSEDRLGKVYGYKLVCCYSEKCVSTHTSLLSGLLP